jgi:hydrogenase maturation factor
MHDVTEGGLANGLHEIAMAAQAGIEVMESEIPMFEESRSICEAFGLDPLGLIASGALLLTASTKEAEKILVRASQQGIVMTRIGCIVEGRPAVNLIGAGGKKSIPYFQRDEVVKVFDPSG